LVRNIAVALVGANISIELNLQTHFGKNLILFLFATFEE